jgi:hypothetical protein
MTADRSRCRPAEGQGLPRLQRHGLQGPRRALRGDAVGDEIKESCCRARRRPRSSRGDPPGHADPAHGGLKKILEGMTTHRRSRAERDASRFLATNVAGHTLTRKRPTGRTPLPHPPQAQGDGREGRVRPPHHRGTPPQLRIDGSLVPLKMTAPLTPQRTPSSSATRPHRAPEAEVRGENEESTSRSASRGCRFRANVFMQRGAVGGAFRMIPFKILRFDELGLPPVVTSCRSGRAGLVLVTGPTGSGKSTTLASMIDKINTTHGPHHHDRGPDRVPAPAQEVRREPARGRQRHQELQGRAQVRAAPGPRRRADRRDARPRDHRGGADHRRDRPPRFATLHTNSAVQTINRIIDVFPPTSRDQIRAQLSFVLRRHDAAAHPAPTGRAACWRWRS